MRLGDLIGKIDIAAVDADMDIEVSGVSFDTRKLRAGEVFVAVRGFESDGHEHIGEAVRKGASCVLCEEPPAVGTPYVLVKDSRKALAAASAAWFRYPASALKVIGVTGTNGKTTVAALIKQVIEKCIGAKVGLIGTTMNMVGDRVLPAERTTPESYEIQELFRMMADQGCQYAVIEVSSHALELGRVHGIEFEVGVFTNLSEDHLDFHASMEDYAKAKSMLFSQCRHAAINIDDAHSPTMLAAATCPVMTYAVNDCAADLVGKSVKLQMDRVGFCALTIGSLNRAALRIPGMFSVYNALAAMATAMLLGVDVGFVASVMQMCEGVKGRAEVVPLPDCCDFTVLIDYAHTPDALENIINAARGFAQGRVVTLFGCGGDRDKIKRPLMGKVAARLSDFVVVTSDNPRTEAPDAIINEILAGMENAKTPRRVIENRREAIHWALENSRPGDVLILAGKGHETYQVFGKEKTRFDEREVVAEYFEIVEREARKAESEARKAEGEARKAEGGARRVEGAVQSAKRKARNVKC